MIFQPAEEVNVGAAKLVDTGLLDDVELFLAGHTYPWLPAGTPGMRPGPVMASADRFSVRIKGKGCHAANPDMGIDPIPALGAIISAFQTVVSRHVNPFDSAVVSITRAATANPGNRFYISSSYPCQEAEPCMGFLFHRLDTCLDTVVKSKREWVRHKTIHPG